MWEFKIVQHHDIARVEARVSELLNDRWRLHGQLVIGPYNYLQALIRHTEAV